MGGLGAVLAITPPQLDANNALSISGASAGVNSGTAEVAPASSSSTSSTAVAESAAPKASAKATAAATKKASSAAQDSAANNSGTTATTATTAPATQAPATTPAAINGVFTGPSVFVNYGNVQVKITVVNGRITDAVAVVAPSGRNDRYTNMAVPILKAQTLKAQSANIQGASGASYTSYGWHTSLQGALAQAGL